ncbi:L7Ae/L30e/S12e/Gadd45 family ribosomal protein [Thermohalobacter berrensis]|uniref:Ribosomal protein eL8/eL30/eS12/Gadd45 domain-containing protein n=1 Tax=Thermohalobacter berrensis TaxID=99594 RepID=A0A419TAK4_9FIRM|nr:ribosomal L7Ae/L30e/S12e/Gadd45 family protein [Thermohalobacter berrensis]RKD34477.1 hypothetical protein BET03_01200 [Thermohalobacter berrensis]
MSKAYTMLGFAQKARKIKYGEIGCTLSVKKKKCKLLIIAKDASKNTKEKFIKLCNKYNVKYIEFGQKDSLGNAIGKGLISVIAICDNNFAATLEDILI